MDILLISSLGFSLFLNFFLYLNRRKWKKNYRHLKAAQTNKLMIYQELKAKRNAMRDIPIIKKRGNK